MKKAIMAPEAYSVTIPAGAVVVDAVTTSKFPLGAVLVRFEATGMYAIVSSGIVHSVSQREAKAYAEGDGSDYNDQYQKECIKRIVVKVNRKLEPDLLGWIESQDNVQKYILDLIRADMGTHKLYDSNACK